MVTRVVVLDSTSEAMQQLRQLLPKTVLITRLPQNQKGIASLKAVVGTEQEPTHLFVHQSFGMPEELDLRRVTFRRFLDASEMSIKELMASILLPSACAAKRVEQSAPSVPDPVDANWNSYGEYGAWLG